jgi:hypothetical protein
MKLVTPLIFIIFSLISCGNNKNEKKLVEEFVENYIVNNDNYNFKGIDKYIHFSNKKKEEKIELAKTILKLKIQEISSFDNYKILNHTDLTNDIKNKINVIYNKDKLYYLIINNEIKMFFIVEEMKIISFVSGLQKNKKTNLYPVFFNKEN